jgi:hypothetical protein
MVMAHGMRADLNGVSEELSEAVTTHGRARQVVESSVPSNSGKRQAAFVENVPSGRR